MNISRSHLIKNVSQFFREDKMNRKTLCFFLIVTITLELLIPCANANGGGKAKKIVMAMKQGAKKTAKKVSKSSVELGKSTVNLAGNGLKVGVEALASAVAIGCFPFDFAGDPDGTMQFVADSTTSLAGSVVNTVNSGIDVGKKSANVAVNLGGSPCICAHQSMKAMKEIEEKEEIAEVLEEERRRRLKELPGPSN
ncbi:uncharacterized protein LOC116338141 isoform X1 [Contarinia nasturtii]|uniref:uncharacterized protein LOC116338141 isoform X1 n=1 Tax=Contarinia nasturtii TaxID=265458 RepID=UPI0012D46B12|nr:uncharacterized protein LOC116338141 isoform X1 [Contarinia nasturtii]